MISHNAAESAAVIGPFEAARLNASGTGSSASSHNATSVCQERGKYELQLVSLRSAHIGVNASLRLKTCDVPAKVPLLTVTVRGTRRGRATRLAADDARKRSTIGRNTRAPDATSTTNSPSPTRGWAVASRC